MDQQSQYEIEPSVIVLAVAAAFHAAAAADDMVFTQYYPILRAAKGAGDDGAGVGGEE